jgi:hypothetical protein
MTRGVAWLLLLLLLLLLRRRAWVELMRAWQRAERERERVDSS